MLMAVSELPASLLPYKTSIGTVWVRNIRHKTGRRDRPFGVANMEALKGENRKSL